MSEAVYERVVYASTATFGGGDLEDPATQRGVMDIVRQSRRNNPEWGIGGALQFADGYFLQVLEGRPEDVESLFSRIEADDRHRDVQVLRRERLDEPAFQGWSMKFLSLEPEVARAASGRRGFAPYELDRERLDTLIGLLLEQEERA